MLILINGRQLYVYFVVTRKKIKNGGKMNRTNKCLKFTYKFSFRRDELLK